MKSKYVKPTMVINQQEIRTIEIKDVAYISARGTIEVFGLDWRRQKEALLDPDSVILYGMIDVSAPEFENSLSLSSGYLGRSDKNDTLFIRMDRAMMFIARISTANMRSKGNNHEGADAVLAKQIEFAQALHEYETMGISVKRNYFGETENRRKSALVFIKLSDAKLKTKDPSERKVFDQLIKLNATDAGATYQPDLLDAILDVHVLAEE